MHKVTGLTVLCGVCIVLHCTGNEPTFHCRRIIHKKEIIYLSRSGH